MAYATVAELRGRYAGADSADGGELDLYSDEAVQQALDDASAEIDSWRPQGTPSAEGLAVLKGKCMTLARLLVHQDQPLGELHPIVRDGREVRAWLRALASGQVSLPSGDSAAAAAAAPRVSAPTEAFGDDFLTRHGVT